MLQITKNQDEIVVKTLNALFSKTSFRTFSLSTRAVTHTYAYVPSTAQQRAAFATDNRQRRDRNIPWIVSVETSVVFLSSFRARQQTGRGLYSNNGSNGILFGQGCRAVRSRRLLGVFGRRKWKYFGSDRIVERDGPKEIATTKIGNRVYGPLAYRYISSSVRPADVEIRERKTSRAGDTQRSLQRIREHVVNARAN